MKRRTLLICTLLSAAMLFASCGKSNNSEAVPTPTPTPTSAPETASPSGTETDNSSQSSFKGQYDITEKDDTLKITITPKEGSPDVVNTDVLYTFKGDAISSVNYTTIYKDAATAKTEYEKMSADVAYKNVKLQGTTVTYDMSEISLELYKGMTRQDVIALANALNARSGS